MHLGEMANESLDDEKSFISRMGSMRVEDYIGVALWGDFMMKMLWGRVGW